MWNIEQVLDSSNWFSVFEYILAYCALLCEKADGSQVPHWWNDAQNLYKVIWIWEFSGSRNKKQCPLGLYRHENGCIKHSEGCCHATLMSAAHGAVLGHSCLWSDRTMYHSRVIPLQYIVFDQQIAKLNQNKRCTGTPMTANSIPTNISRRVHESLPRHALATILPFPWQYYWPCFLLA